MQRHNLTNKTELMTTYFLSEEEVLSKYDRTSIGICYAIDKQIYLNSVFVFLHEYSHYVGHLLNPASTASYTWQSQAFAEWGGSYSYLLNYGYSLVYLQDEQFAEIFRACVGRDYEMCREDYLLMCDVTCYAYDAYEIGYLSGMAACTSLTKYLVDIYGEDVIMDLLLHPNKVQEVTGADWDSLQADWQLSIKQRFKNAVLPDWLTQEE